MLKAHQLSQAASLYQSYTVTTSNLLLTVLQGGSLGRLAPKSRRRTQDASDGQVPEGPSTSHHEELAPEMQRLSDVQEHEVLLTSILNPNMDLGHPDPRSLSNMAVPATARSWPLRCSACLTSRSTRCFLL